MSKIDQNVHGSTEFNFDKCYRLASCELQRRDQGRSYEKLIASGFSSSDCPKGAHNSTKCMILQASDCPHNFVLLVLKSTLDTTTNNPQLLV